MTFKTAQPGVHQAKVTSKGQVTIPKAVRDRLKLEEGSILNFIEEGEAIVLRPQQRARRSFHEAIGTLDPEGMTADEYVSSLRHGPGDREALQSGGGGPKRVVRIGDILAGRDQL